MPNRPAKAIKGYRGLYKLIVSLRKLNFVKVPKKAKKCRKRPKSAQKAKKCHKRPKSAKRPVRYSKSH
jgi:hypothetical protein